MTQDEKFAIWDATHPEVKEVRAYLDRLCGKTPLPLVYLYPKEHYSRVVTDVLPEEKDHLAGILLNENTVLYLKAFTKKDFKSLFDKDSVDNATEQCISAWVKSQFSTLPNARAATKQDIELLYKKGERVLTTMEILDYHGIKLPRWKYLGWLNKGSYEIEDSEGSARIYHFLEVYGDLLIFSDYSADDELLKESIRQQYFQSAGQ